MNDKLILRALRMLRQRAAYYEKEYYKTMKIEKKALMLGEKSAYDSACDILRYAILDDEECLKEFDCYDAD